MKRPMLDAFARQFRQAAQVERLLESLARQPKDHVVSGLRSGASAALAAALGATAGRPILFITSNLERAESLADGATFFGARAELLPAYETLPFELAEPALHITAARGQAIEALRNADFGLGIEGKRGTKDAGGRGEISAEGVRSSKKKAPDPLPAKTNEAGGSGKISVKGVGSLSTPSGAKNDSPDRFSAPDPESAPGPVSPLIVAPVEALLHRILPAEALERQALTIEWGEAVDLDELALRLVEMGYDRESLVESPGEFSIRGTIVDLYPPEAEWPIRLDFFGEELESIRLFDPATQRSVAQGEEPERVRVLPRALHGPALEHLKQGGKLGTVFDLLPANTLIVLDGPSRVGERIEYFEGIAEKHAEELKHRRDQDDEPENVLSAGVAPEDWLVSTREAEERLASWQRLNLIDLSIEAEELEVPDERRFTFGAQGFEGVAPTFKDFVELIRKKQHEQFRTAIVCDNPGQAMRLDELLRENHISAVLDIEKPEPEPGAEGVEPEAAAAGSEDGEGGETRTATARLRAAAHDVLLVTGELHEGFIFDDAELLLLTDREMFGRYKRRRIYRKARHGKSFADPTEIQRGDYVVHADHGIGLFEQIRRQKIDGRFSEFLEIVYSDGDRLLVPVDKLHFIQKYSASDGKTPTLDKLGHKRWQKRRTKTKEAVRKLAGELLELYAQREASSRDPFGPDTVWQQEFEASFIYRETPDQLRAIEEVKHDLTGPRPADRLVCGDVGYGKTEVAIRAAFKALVEKRQVAVLVPTTLLAQQHFGTFSERLADYPFRIAMLSRFQSAAEAKKTLKALAAGEVDLIVGTHRLLSKDVKFKDLGLLVIDEEQRFGVGQKEKIKAFKPTVDVITLTATPIPRTLHFALAKLRDLSLIQTPPADRLPIKTRTIYFEKDYIEEAILRELNRGGQVYFVHNRVASIKDVAESVREIVPRARIAVAHGQMDESELEQIMMDFIARKYDILLSTTIIENGIDIPNVNTIIINRADAFGLAQLYQLRGRVGRDVRQAYAYLILPRGRAITDQATKRLAALEEFTELGMGFSVAMRDMEIRGTGSILGAEQSGAITDVGFDLYCQLLEEAVQELRGEPAREAAWPTEVKWPVDQWLPEDYVPVEAQRIRFYRQLAGAQDVEAVERVGEELLDRFGPPPPPAVNLLAAFGVRMTLAAWKADLVRCDDQGRIRITTQQDPKALAEALARRVADADWADRVRFRADGAVTIYPAGEADERPSLSVLLTDFGRRIQALEPVPAAAV